MASNRTLMLAIGLVLGAGGLIAAILCGVLIDTSEGPVFTPVTDGYVEIRHGDDVVLVGQVGVTLDGSGDECTSEGENVIQCFEWENTARLEIRQETPDDIICNRVSWQAMTPDVVLQDCYELGDAHWFGSANRFFQHWPINEWNESMTMYVSGDMYANYNDYGSVLERYWLSSKGVAIRASHNSPLHVSLNYDDDGLVCFKGEYRNSYYPSTEDAPQPFLDYTICTGENTRVIHDYMTQRYVKKPSGLPDIRMMRSPIWSTWARYKTTVNQSLVLGFADEITANGFNNSQIEIDDGYAGRNYGDFFFDENKFPDPVQMITELHDKNFRVTLWVTPFANSNTDAFIEGDENGFWVKNEDGSTALIRWWAGIQAGMLDVTNPEAVSWFVNRLEEVRSDYGIDSFKFDAGETNYLGYHKTMVPIVNPCEYTTEWVKLAAQLGRQIEVRVGFETQNQPIFVRMMDKDSKWGWNNGLKTLITSALSFSVLGYPYVLADMIGGNVYEGGFRETYLPDKELFIRWLQITAFMPSMQYSISPWQYEDDPEVVEISRRWTSFHENVITPILVDLAETEAIPEGKPMIRPLWWIAPTDEHALLSDDQFLVGDDMLVAPIVENGTLSRDVYLPKGKWRDELHGTEHDGGTWLIDVGVPLSEALYYTRL
ncbi:myogenesis-regulating glycosidase-like [Lytechinus variegatus]|uniref:myogenesis-regulating glycosidase-like n=1 Tax=Lytechinus variegatus TaxID=7654 RepID=UPI001BB12502|nr:myogenesis-regulating glycosidase-like [Lytechinus variegatus]